MLKFDGAWRFSPPNDGRWQNSSIPGEAINAFRDLINKVATQGERQEMLEHFKGAFSAAAGMSHSWSSSVSWAESDLYEYMDTASVNAPLFIEAFFDACEALRRGKEGYGAPDAAMINDVCLKHDIGYEVRPPDLLLREEVQPLVSVPDKPPTLSEQAINQLQQSLQRPEELLSEGHGREAVQETLWLLESVSTAFRGTEATSGVIRGKYFNQIVRDLRKLYSGTALDQILKWTTELHGYLSSPTGGGVRHGVDFQKGTGINLGEARLFCNLIRSYLTYLLTEHERLTRQKQLSGAP